MPYNIRLFRDDYPTRLYQALRTGLSMETLLQLSENFHGNFLIENVFEAEYPDDEEDWSIESLPLGALTDYFEAAEMLQEATGLDLVRLDTCVKEANGRHQLRNLLHRPLSVPDIERIDAKLTRVLLGKISELLRYLSSRGVPGESGRPLQGLRDWKSARDFVLSLGAKDFSAETALDILHFSRRSKELPVAEFLAQFPSQEEGVSFRDVVNLILIAPKLGLGADEAETSGRAAFDRIVKRILEEIRRNECGEWERPWISRKALLRPRNFVSGTRYRGMNALNLWSAARAGNLSSPYWATERQWEARGFRICRGQQGTLIFCAFKIASGREHDEERGDEREEKPLIMGSRWGYRSYRVFNASQLEGFEQVPALQIHPEGEAASDAKLDAFVERTGALVRPGGNRAFFDPSRDLIRIPHREQFVGNSHLTGSQAYYSTLLHELVHWSGHESRLKRAYGSFGDSTYAFEELVAELGSAFLCSDFGILNVPREELENAVTNVGESRPAEAPFHDHSAYIASWAQGFGDEMVRRIVLAANMAEKAVAHLQETQGDCRSAPPISAHGAR